MTFRHWARVHTWDEAVVWLEGGRNPDLRPLYHAGLYVRRMNPGDPNSPIAIGWFHKYARQDPNYMHRNTILIYHKGDIAELSGLNVYPSARRAMKYYANLVDLYKRNGKIKIRQSTDKVITSKRRVCNMCKGMRSWIYRNDAGDVIKHECTNCTDGYGSSRTSHYAMTWPTQTIQIQYSDVRIMENEILVPVYVDLHTGLVKGTGRYKVDGPIRVDSKLEIDKGGEENVYNV